MNPSRPGPNDLHFSSLTGTPSPIGERFVFLPQEGSTLLRLELAASHLIEAIALVYLDDNKTEHRLQAGHKTATTWQTVSLEAGLVGLSGQSGWYLDALRSHFADGSETGLFGGTGGDISFRMNLHQKNGVWQGKTVGLWGYADEVGLEALGLIFWSSERTV